jgi:putative tryptophan/tyrosine transport system substrate-binding protein
MVRRFRLTFWQERIGWLSSKEHGAKSREQNKHTRALMRKTVFGFTLSTLLLALCPSAESQPAKVPQVGFLVASSSSFYSSRIEAFRQGLRELGYVEGTNIAIEYRFAEGKAERLRQLAAELVRLKVDIIVAAGSAAAAKDSTTTIPIVFAASADPVASGIVASLAQPGGNVTGLTILAPELTGKRLELLKEAFPRVTRVAFLRNPSGINSPIVWKEAIAASQSLGLQLQSVEVRNPDDFERAFEAVKRERAHALITSTNPLINAHRARILEFVAKNRLPAIYPAPEVVEAGGLMSYSPDYSEMFRRAALFVHKILNGAKPGDLPVEQPNKFELVINLKTANQIGLIVPPNVLARADKVIR